MKINKYFKFRLIVCVVLFFVINKSFAQSLTHQWIAVNGGAEYDAIIKVSTDKNSNVISYGDFQKTIDLDPSANTVNKVSNGLEDCYIQKLDVNGKLKWAVSFGSDQTEIPYSVSVDKSGNVFAIGFFQDTVDFDPGPNSYKISNALQAPSLFILKLDSNGGFVWAKALQNVFSTVSKSAISLDNNLVIAGTYEKTVDFDPDAGTTNLTAGTDIKNAFVCKYNNTTGALVWAKDFRTAQQYVELNDVSIDKAGNILTCGFYETSVDFDPSGGTYTLSPNYPNFQEAYVCKLNTNGGLIWAKSFDGSSVQAYRVSTDASDNVCIGGTFYAIADFDPGAGEFLESSSNSNLYLAKLDKNGLFKWVNNIQVNLASTSFIKSVSLDLFDNIVIAGNFTDTVDFDPTYAGKLKLGSGKYIPSIFIAKYKSDGTFVYAKQFGSKTEASVSFGATYGADGKLYHGGIFNGNVDFGLNTSPVLKTSIGGADEFVQKLSCTIGNNVIRSGAQLNSSVSGATYQWINCTTGEIIAGEVSQTFLPNINGKYAIAVNKGECTEVSPCYNLNNLSVQSINYGQIKVYPNPANDLLFFENRRNELIDVKLFDSKGLLLLHKNNFKSTDVLNVNFLFPGFYVIEIEDEFGYASRIKLVKN